ncbi:MAG: IS21 family transposase [Spirochaetia bacterium]|jgi:transposase|nr:IS21 family transposase [Spirochaetia bacterium]
MDAKGKSIPEIARALSIDYKTAKKYVEKEDFSIPAEPICRERPSVLDPYKEEIRRMVDQSMKWPKKQRYTAKRILVILRGKHAAFPCSYNTVCRFVRSYKAEVAGMKLRGFEELVWHKGEAQCDFGEAGFFIDGRIVILKYLVLSFPYSNKPFVQLFKGETAECVCQGLMDIFGRIGGVPVLIVFDNATGIGRRIGDVLQLSKLFTNFSLHFRFRMRFCNPRSGNEKGNVEANVGYIRRNAFVPPLEIPGGDIAAFNRSRMFSISFDIRKGEDRYKAGLPVDGMFVEDREALLPLPQSAFYAASRDTHEADSYGNLSLDNGKHTYKLGPKYRHATVIVDRTAWEIKVYTVTGRPIHAFRREYGSQRTSTYDALTMLQSLQSKPGAWPNSILREQMPSNSVRGYIDGLASRKKVSETLRALCTTARQFSYPVALSAFEQCLLKNAAPSPEDVRVVARRISTFGLGESENATGVDLSKYDMLVNAKEAR